MSLIELSCEGLHSCFRTFKIGDLVRAETVGISEGEMEAGQFSFIAFKTFHSISSSWLPQSSGSSERDHHPVRKLRPFEGWRSLVLASCILMPGWPVEPLRLKLPGDAGTDGHWHLQLGPGDTASTAGCCSSTIQVAVECWCARHVQYRFDIGILLHDLAIHIQTAQHVQPCFACSPLTPLALHAHPYNHNRCLQ